MPLQMPTNTALARKIRAASPLEQMINKEGTSLADLQQSSYRRIRDAMGDAQVVLIGEATHGTEEFYRIRADLTKVLIENDHFDAVLCEGDFPPFFELNRFVGGAPAYRALPNSLPRTKSETRIDAAMAGFSDRFPGWMWQNNVVRDFGIWLREFNVKHHDRLPTQILGLDIYSLFRSADEVLNYLNEAGETDLASAARRRYEALNCFRPNASDYTNALYNDTVLSQSHNVTKMLLSLYNEELRLSRMQGNGHEVFNALENARVVASAEEYYRQSLLGGDVTWNIRDAAFLDAIKETITFVENKKRELGDTTKARVAVWAHNSHVGDAAETAHVHRGQHNLGQLCRRFFGRESVYIVGFSTHDGTVRAARKWGGQDVVMKLNPSFESSAESVLHSVATRRGQNAFGYLFRTNPSHGEDSPIDEAAKKVLGDYLLQRFVGVNYIKATELRSHYSLCSMSDQYDFLIHVDRTSALRVDRTSHHEAGPKKMMISAAKRHDRANRAKRALVLSHK